MRFNDNLHWGKHVPNHLGQDEIRHQPQLFRASAEYAYRLGGPYMRSFINSLPLSKDFKYISIDSRVHMLMPGWLPCIGGWHCDDFWRPTGKQPDLEGMPDSRHHTLVLGYTAMTEFISEPFELEVPGESQLQGRNLYGVLGARLNGMLSSIDSDDRPRLGAPPFLRTTKCESGSVVTFDNRVFHRGTVADKSGWRLFIRATESNHWEPKDEIRTQTQVYLLESEVGW